MPIYHYEKSKKEPLPEVFNASLTSANAETGQTLTATGNVTYSADGAVFDGSSYLTTDAGLSNLSKGTFHCKFKRTATTGVDVQTIFCMGNSGDYCQIVAFIWNSDGKLVITNHGEDLNTSLVVQNGVEYELTVTFNENQCTVYVDGQQVASGYLSLSPNSNYLMIGAWNRDVTSYFNGTISDFHILPDVVSVDQIEYIGKTLYQSTGFDEMGFAVPYYAASGALCSIVQIPSRGLVFYAPFSENKATAETGQTLNVSGNPVYGEIGGIPCVTFDGSSGYSTPGIDVSQFVDGFTVSCFAQPADRGSHTIVLGRRNGTYSCQYAFKLGIQEISCWAANSDVTANVSKSDLPEINKMTHAAWRYKDGKFDLFIGGELVASGNGTIGSQDSGDTQIAATLYSSENYVGSLAALRLYNRALTDDEIMKLAGEFDV